MLRFVVVVAVLATGAFCKEQFADVNVNSNTIDDKKVEALLIKDKLDSSLTDFVVKTLSGKSLTEVEAFGIVGKIRNRDLLEKAALEDAVKKILDIADLFKQKLDSCSSTKGKDVDSFIKSDLYIDLKKRFLLLHDNFQCPDVGSGLATEEDIASGDADFATYWKLVEEFKARITTKPLSILGDITDLVQSTGYLSKEHLPMVAMIGGEILKNPEVVDFITGSIDQFEAFFKAESGKRMLKIFPKLLTAEVDEAISLFSEEADYNQELFFSLMKNDDIATHFIKQAAKMILTMFQWGKAFLDDQMRLALVNGVLISNDFPPIKKGKLLKSACGILEKGLRLFTTSSFEGNFYDEVKVISDEFEKMYFKYDDFARLSEDELVNVLTKFMNDNILTQGKDAYLCNKQVTMVNKDCAEMSLCLYNQKYNKSNLIIKTLVKGTSVSLVYSWDYMYENMDFDKSLAAIVAGMDGDKSCNTLYPTAPKICDVFQDNKVGMDLNYNHNEL